MLQFVVQDDGQQAHLLVACPFVIGRGSLADLQLVRTGVWDTHAEVILDSASGKLAIQPVGDALLLVNGQRSERKVLVPGDELQIGEVSIFVSLSPVRQRNLVGPEAVVWIILALAVVLESLLLLALN